MRTKKVSLKGIPAKVTEDVSHTYTFDIRTELEKNAPVTSDLLDAASFDEDGKFLRFIEAEEEFEEGRYEAYVEAFAGRMYIEVYDVERYNRGDEDPVAVVEVDALDLVKAVVPDIIHQGRSTP